MSDLDKTLAALKDTQESIEAAITFSKVIELVAQLGNGHDSEVTEEAIRVIRLYGDSRAVRNDA